MKPQMNPNLMPLPIMKNLLRSTNRSKKYKNISQDMRNQIIYKLTQEKQSLKQVSDEFSLKPSTIKAIIKVFQEEGRIGKKSTRERKIKIMNTVILALNDDNGNITPFTLSNFLISDIILDPNCPKITENTLQDLSLKQNASMLRQLLETKNKQITHQFHNQHALNNFINQCTYLEQNPMEFITSMKKSTIDQQNFQNLELTEEEKQVADQIYEVLKAQAGLQTHSHSNIKTKEE